MDLNMFSWKKDSTITLMTLKSAAPRLGLGIGLFKVKRVYVCVEATRSRNRTDATPTTHPLYERLIETEADMRESISSVLGSLYDPA
jgi:hypothetical protein